MEYKGIIFDLDGTIIDTVLDLHDSLNAILEKNDFPKVTLEQTREYIGNGIFNLIKRAIPEERKEDTEFINQNVIDFREEYRKRITNKSRAFPGIDKILNYCNQNNIKLGVASNKSDYETRLIMQKIFPSFEFDYISGHKENEPLKPDPGIINKILNKMNLNSKDILYIGDSITDYQTAQNAGLDMILVTYGYEKIEKLKKLPGIKLLDNVNELYEFIVN